jgi:hypothetical protein
MENESPKKMSYFEFLALQESEQNGFFILTLGFGRSKVIIETYCEDGIMVGTYREYQCWDYILDDVAPKKTPLYKYNPLNQIGFYNKEGVAEGEFIDFYYE